jgi:hypothetical protein
MDLAQHGWEVAHRSRSHFSPAGTGEVGREPSNKGMKLTKPEHIGALQPIPGVRRLLARALTAHSSAV